MGGALGAGAQDNNATSYSTAGSSSAPTLKDIKSREKKSMTLPLLLLKEASKIRTTEWRPNELANVIWFLAKCESNKGSGILDSDLLLLLRDFHRLRPENVRRGVLVRMEDSL